jgi:hypothetical protein
MSYITSETAGLFDKNEVKESSLPHDEIERNLFLDEEFIQEEKKDLSQTANN